MCVYTYIYTYVHTHHMQTKQDAVVEELFLKYVSEELVCLIIKNNTKHRQTRRGGRGALS
jgi:hypothetical protein